MMWTPGAEAGDSMDRFSNLGAMVDDDSPTYWSLESLGNGQVDKRYLLVLVGIEKSLDRKVLLLVYSRCFG